MLIKLNNISKRFGGLELFRNVNLTIFEKQKIGVIGRNGAGKSTLCRMIIGEEEPDSGMIEGGSGLRIGYVEQHNPFESGETALEFLMRYTGKEEWMCGKTAGRFNIKNDLLTGKRIGELSGGYQTRLKLTAMLVKEPNFLILDEPTNFLDLNTLILLEYFLADYAGGFLIVSHDREFLKRTCRETLEIENGDVALFPGTVEEYLAYKEEIVGQTYRYNRNIEEKQKQLQAFIDRFRAKNTKASQARSKQKQLDRLEKIEIEHPVKSVRISIPQVDIRKGMALECRDLKIGYPEKTVAGNINLDIERGTHLAVLGDNGQGKTTFLRTIAGRLPALGGTYRWSRLLDTAYFAQNVYASLDPGMDVFSYLQAQAATDVLRQEILDMAGSLLFRGEDVLKPIKVLSGGERARLCLAGLLLSRKSAFILDEPTNHLDFETVEALANALRQYRGTILFVSHDRTFVNLTATGIIDVKDGKIVHYPGTYEDYVYLLEKNAAAPDGFRESEIKPREKKLSESKAQYQFRKELRSKINKVKRQVGQVETTLRAYEKERDAITDLFSNRPEEYSDERSRRLKELYGLIESQENQWLELQSLIEGLEKEARES